MEKSIFDKLSGEARDVKLIDELLTVHYITKPASLAKDAIGNTITRRALQRVASYSAQHPEHPVTLYIYETLLQLGMLNAEANPHPR